MSKKTTDAVILDLPIFELPAFAPYCLEGIFFLPDFEYGYDQLQYFQDEFKAGRVTPWNVQVTHFVQMTHAQYRQFSVSLHSEYDWLEGKGSEFYTGSRECANYATLTPQQQSEFLTTTNRLCVMVVNQLTQERIFVDPVRSKFPLFVGISA